MLFIDVKYIFNDETVRRVKHNKLVIHYNYGKGEYKELECVPAPDDISDYVIKMVSALPE